MKPRGQALERLLELERDYALPAGSAEQLMIVLTELESETASVTTVRDPRTAADVHVADSLVALQLPEIQQAQQIADLGAGGGFPGLALAVALPDAQVSLVESVGRKCEFMNRAAGLAQIGNAQAVHARAEEWDTGIGINDVVVARALAPLPAIAEYAAPLLREGGLMVAYKARRDPSEEAAGYRAAGELGLSPGSVLEVDPYPGAGERHLHLFRKTAPTPNRFPRRAGMARKRPLGTAR